MISTLGTAITTYLLIVLAELGDKSQIICLVLAARYPARPVFLGALTGFAVLSLLAVVLGAGLGAILPETLMHLAVALLFGFFGWRTWREAERAEAENLEEVSHGGVFITALLMIGLSEMGDKTQLAVAGLSSIHPPSPVFLGALLALATTSALGIWVGKKLLRPGMLRPLHRIGGALFILLGVVAAYQAYLDF